MAKKIGRNEQCPCGSGLKYKYCCGSDRPITKSKAILGWSEWFTEAYDYWEVPPDRFNPEPISKDTHVEYRSEDGLKSYFDQVYLQHENQFDTHYSQEFEVLSNEFVSLLQFRDFVKGNVKAYELRYGMTSYVGSIISHMLISVEAAIDMLRRGYRYQIPVLLRHVIESAAVTICMLNDEEWRQKVFADSFESNKAIGTAKKYFPVIGKLYGIHSNHFSHLDKLHFEWEPVRSLNNISATHGCIKYIKESIVLTRLCVELGFY